MAQQTSSRGILFMEVKENVVLKAYRDVVGVWTIGGGLTAASGVVTPKAGMVISAAEARNLMQRALRRNYEPRVIKALGPCKQHVFDGAVSFDWNTGAIGRAGWVRALLARDFVKARSGLMVWVKGGGKVLPGLKRRRAEEADIILLDKWPADMKLVGAPAANTNGNYADFVVSVSPTELAEIRNGFRIVGFDPGSAAGFVLKGSVEAFQRRFDLTVDGKIGKATLSTLQRELDARKGTKAGAGAATGGGVVVGGNETINPVSDSLLAWAGFGVAILATIYLAYLAWHYRDVIAARLQGVAPRLAGWLRSF